MEVNEQVIKQILGQLINQAEVLVCEDYFYQDKAEDELEVLNKAYKYKVQAEVLKDLLKIIADDKEIIDKYELGDVVDADDIR